ncbi:hypothetical protein BKI52_25845 [marine bacterium AO1-C]|nr:hypothetical protein BKI52_25845 [marine bacterium AO1-C]
MKTGKKHVSGILIVYHLPIFYKQGATVQEHIFSFIEHSEFPIYGVNTELAFPKDLAKYSFDAIILHYSVFAAGHTYEFSSAFLNYLREHHDTPKIAFFQDDYRNCQKRFKFIDEYNIDTVYTCMPEKYHDLVYKKYSNASTVFTTLTGYVTPELPQIARKFRKPSSERTIDIGYRARQLDYYMGIGAQEKHEIGEKFLKISQEKGFDLALDIEVQDQKRLYGDDWYRFMGDCKGMLGVESGVSIIDVEDKVKEGCDAILKENPNITFQEIYDMYLHEWDNKLPYRTISPRHFEAAAFKTCQILFEGEYSGILKPNVHYIPLKKDFSNIDEVIQAFKNDDFRNQIVENAYNDFIDTDQYGYRAFINQEFDVYLKSLGLTPQTIAEDIHQKLLALGNYSNAKHLKYVVTNFWKWNFPGRKVIVPFVKKMVGHK